MKSLRVTISKKTCELLLMTRLECSMKTDIHRTEYRQKGISAMKRRAILLLRYRWMDESGL